ncbi:caspase family protein [Labrys neptuniae]|uniref:caspase family protein n=1 Tax=Labrys neptuniae TaxID=376174 RepID=UPI00289203F9|nr:caspase family protein [Labrys neptuniae]MDT3379533.1 caspase family protein [Labrys neptuniae]
MRRLKPPILGTLLAVILGTSLAAATTAQGQTKLTATELQRYIDICFKAKDGNENVAACTAALSAGEKQLSKPNRAMVLYSRAIGYTKLQQFDPAVADVTKGLALTPQSAKHCTLRALLYRKQGKNDLALADFKEAVNKGAKGAGDYADRGRSYFDVGDYEKALGDFDTSLRTAPDNAMVHGYRGVALLRLGRVNEAVTDLTFQIEKGGNNVIPGDYTHRGFALIELGKADEAKADFAKAEALATGKIEGTSTPEAYWYVDRAFARALGDNPDGAVADISRYLSTQAQTADAFQARALAYAAKRNYRDALADFSQAINLDRKKLFILRQRGDVYLAAGQPELAIADYQAQLSQIAGNALAMTGLEKAKQAMAAKLQASATPPQSNSASTTGGAPPSQAKAELGRRVALVIGNSNYANVAALPNPKNDAAKVADTLRKIGFTEVTLAEDTDFRSLNRALQDFASQADGADWAVIYYAGHGIEIANTNYLVPVDAKLASDRDVTFEAVPLDRVMTASEGAKGMRLVILDACRNNPFLANMTRKTATRAVSRGLSRVEPDGGTLVVYAAKAGEIALDGSGGNSPFVTALTTNLQKPGIEIGKLFRLVRDDVMKTTDRKQEPFTYGSLPGEDFIFNPG